jgi:dCMP deaminase
MTEKRSDALPWGDTFMAIASVVKLRSKDPSTQVGACVVSSDNRILSVGYNGAPNGFHDYDFPWAREGDPYETKYPYVVHAERNAILNFRGSLREFEGATIYVTHFPCNECAKEIVQSGIREVVYLKDSKDETLEVMASKRIFRETGINFRQAEEPVDKVEVDLTNAV